jgi:hypothetical protein
MALEWCRSIDKAKRNDCALVVTMVHADCSLPLETVRYPELMIGLTNVKLLKIVSTR